MPCSGAHVSHRPQYYSRLCGRHRQRGRVMALPRSFGPPSARWRGTGTDERFERFGQAEIQDLYRTAGFTFTFAGFRSRWMMPFSCAYRGLRAICLAICRESASGIGTVAGVLPGVLLAAGRGMPWPYRTTADLLRQGRSTLQFVTRARTPSDFQAIDRSYVGRFKHGQYLRLALEAPCARRLWRRLRGEPSGLPAVQLRVSWICTLLPSALPAFPESCSEKSFATMMVTP